MLATGLDSECMALSGVLLDGIKVRLRPFTAAHIQDDYLGWLADKQLLKFSRQRHRTHTRESCLAYLEGFSGTPHYFWAVERVGDGRHVGTMTCYVDELARTADLGILIGRSSAGCGYGAEAWGLGLRHGFEALGLRKITGGTVSRNVAMVRIFERWGMVREGVQREQELLEDGPDDVVLYGMLRSEWSERRG